MAYSMEFRLAVVTAHDACGSSAEVAEEFGCSASWVRRLMQRERESGSLEPKPPKRPDNSKLDQADLDRLAAVIAERPDLTLAELAAAPGNKVSVPTVLRARRELGFSRKKVPPRRRAEPPRREGRTRRVAHAVHGRGDRPPGLPRAGSGLRAVTPEDALAFITHCGYAATIE